MIVPKTFNYSPILGGNTATYSWSGFNRATYPLDNSGTAANWGVTPGMPSSIGPSNVVSANYSFAPTPGFGTDTTNFLPASQGGGIYSFFSASHFSLTSTSPLADLNSLVFQIFVAAGFDNPNTFTGAADLIGSPSLTLTLQGGGTQVIPLLSSYLNSSEASTVQFPTTLDLLSFEWDLSGVTQNITGYSVSWQAAYHSITYGMSVFESDAVHTSSILAVPEPSSVMLLSLGALGLLARRKKSARWTS